MGDGRQPIEMKVELLVGESARELAEWVLADPDLRGPIQAQRTPPRPGELGAADVILTGLFAPATLVALLRATQAWTARRRVPTHLVIETSDVRVDVVVDDRIDPLDTVERVFRAVKSLRRPPPLGDDGM